MSSEDVVYTNKKEVECSGKDLPLDHPKIYLEIDKSLGYVTCPYCSNRFTLK
ncbi:MAG: zinc-finger domain-containing protein [Rickettsiaceae bacterium]|nr:zinc-finger domain-containing protein [Rickettsiaceae bacterium]